ncbi:hypothetical protein STA3757_09450 [Stanieria sp. NIES-3757]|nr:hypothetical protein STA3757_09450 [Stanieria sp. NIES-3757]
MVTLPSLQTERIESCKAGVLASIAFSMSELGMQLFNTIVLLSQGEQLEIFTVSLGIEFLSRVAIAAISGFLFGVTYRYIIRGDNNFHLKDGSVLAFGIVRGLALWEGMGIISGQLWLVGLLFGESLFCFALTRFFLDFALERKIIKPFL